MKKIYLMLLLIAIMLSGCQVNQEQIQLDKIAYEKAVVSTINRNFIIMSDESKTPYSGQMVFVPNDGKNFICVFGEEGVMQFYSMNDSNLGGMTMRGKVKNFKIKTDNKGKTNISFNIQTPTSKGYTQFSLDEKSNHVKAKVSFGLGKCVTIKGTVLPYDVQYHFDK